MKGWLASKPIHSKNCVRLSIQYRSRDINLLYLVADRNFTPLLGCDACLDIEVLKLIDTRAPQSEPSVQETVGVFQTDFVLRDFEHCFDDKPGKLNNNVHLEVDPLKPPVVRPPRKNCPL